MNTMKKEQRNKAGHQSAKTATSLQISKKMATSLQNLDEDDDIETFDWYNQDKHVIHCHHPCYNQGSLKQCVKQISSTFDAKVRLLTPKK